MNIVPIRNLEPHQSRKKIRVRVCRIWRPKIIKSIGKFDGLHCIVVDAMGDAIEGCIKDVDYDFVAPKIEAGCLYDITDFNTAVRKPDFQIVPHHAQLNFNARTIFSKLSNVHPAIQRHRFYLQDYKSLSSRVNNTSLEQQSDIILLLSSSFCKCIIALLIAALQQRNEDFST